MVTRCVCCDVALTELLALARNHELTTVESLHTVACFGQGCGLCLPYVALALRTGRTAFDPAATDAADADTTTDALELEAFTAEVLNDAEALHDEAASAVRRDGE